jgi:hypothetical protein
MNQNNYGGRWAVPIIIFVALVCAAVFSFALPSSESNAAIVAGTDDARWSVVSVNRIDRYSDITVVCDHQQGKEIIIIDDGQWGGLLYGDPCGENTKK